MPWCSKVHQVYAASWHLRADARQQGRVTLVCRVTIEEMAWEDNDGGIQDEDSVVCIQQVDTTGEGGDSSTILSLADMPSYVYKNNEMEISIGKLYMSLSNVIVQGGKIVMTSDTEFTILANPGGNRKLEEDELPIGDKTLAIIRVSTRDAQVTASSNELRDIVLGDEDGPTIISQYAEMSFGQLQFRPIDVFDIWLDANIATFESGMDISTAVELAMVEQLGLETASDLADRVFFCIPPGIQKGFIAFTYGNYWRATFSDTWCHSLSATIHEVGHTFGLGHSHLAAEGDNQDVSCYMSLGTGEKHSPRQSFNAHKGWQTDWYASRHLAFDPLAVEIRLIQVSALVDFELASTSQPVIVNIADHLYMQYNRAKSFNSDTRGSPDRLVVVEAYESGNSGVVASLSSADGAFEITDYKGSGQSLIIDVCREEYGDKGTPDIMVVSIGFGESICSSLEEPPPPRPRPSATPIRDPTLSPIHAPSHAPTAKPSVMALLPPQPRPTVAPITAPTHSPIHAPSHEPTKTPSPPPQAIPSAAPISAPTRSPIHAPSHAPTAKPTVKPSTPIVSPSQSPTPLSQERIKEILDVFFGY
jgi:hypothetical protein